MKPLPYSATKISRSLSPSQSYKSSAVGYFKPISISLVLNDALPSFIFVETCPLNKLIETKSSIPSPFRSPVTNVFAPPDAALIDLYS